MDPTYMAWARWKNSFDGTAGQYVGGFFEYDSQWVDIGHWPPPRTHTIGIGKHLNDADKWKYIIHEATHWGGWPESRHPLIENITDHCVERNKKEEERLKRKKNPPHAPGWSGRSPYDTGRQPIGSSGSCTIIFSSRCGGGGAGEPGTCDDDPSNNEGDGSEGNPICTLGEIVVGGCTHSVTKVCSGIAMLLEDAGLLLADVGGEELACPATPAAGPSTAPGERPAWIAEAAVAPPNGRQRREAVGKRRNDGFRAIPAGSEVHRATERP